MQKFTNKNVIAIGITPRIDEYKRDLIQEFMDGTHPLSSHRKTEDSGARRKVFLEQSPAGPNETGGPDDRLSHDGVGSDYGPGRADDEVGPGNTLNPDPEQEFTTPDTVNRIFGNDDDLSDKFSPLNTGSRQRDQNVTIHLRRLHSRPTPVQSLPQRLPVDLPKDQPEDGMTVNIPFPRRKVNLPHRRRKAASTNWAHLYV